MERFVNVCLVAAAMIASTAMIVSFIGKTHGAQSLDCEHKWSESGIEYKFDGACKINIDGHWIPDSAYKVIGMN
jgi:hypothetical protein